MNDIVKLGKKYQVTYKAWMTFFKYDNYTFRSEPQMPFKSIGLMIFDAPKNSSVHVKIANSEELVVSYPGVPSRIFSRANSFEELQKLALEDEYNLTEWIDFQEVYPGLRVDIKFDTPINDNTQVAIYGHAYKN